MSIILSVRAVGGGATVLRGFTPCINLFSVPSSKKIRRQIDDVKQVECKTCQNLEKPIFLKIRDSKCWTRNILGRTHILRSGCDW